MNDLFIDHVNAYIHMVLTFMYFSKDPKWSFTTNSTSKLPFNLDAKSARGEISKKFLWKWTDSTVILLIKTEFVVNLLLPLPH